MRKAIKSILVLVVMGALMVGCTKNDDENEKCLNPVEVKAACSEDAKKTNIRIKNTSDKDFSNITISADCKKVNYGTLKSGQTSCYEIYEKMYRYASITLQIDGKEYKLMPVDFVGETPLGIGKFTYAVAFTSPENRLSMTTTKD